MQQQIQVDKNQEIKNQENHKLIKVNENDRGFQMIDNNDEIIEEDITQNYEQDFDSISNESHHAQENENQIKEDFAQVQQIIQQQLQQPYNEKQQNLKERLNFQSNSQTQVFKIQNQCKTMQLQINRLKEQIRKKQLQQEYSDDKIQDLKIAVQSNNQILRNLQLEQINFFQTKIGKDSYCIQLLQSPQELQEKLIEEIEKLKQLINMVNTQVCKIKRETKKNQQILPLEQQNKEEFYQKYKKLKKQIDEKRQKHTSQESKEQDLDAKLSKMKEKYFQIESLLINLPDVDKKIEEQQKLIIKYQDLNKKREAESKKNTFAMHQALNNTQSIARNILQLRRQNNQFEQKINALNKKNDIMQADSNRLMQKFQQINLKLKQKSVQQQIEKNNSYCASPLAEPKLIPQTSSRRKYYSEAKNSFITNIFESSMPINIQIAKSTSNDRYIPKIINNDKNCSQDQNVPTNKVELGQSSTSNTIKPFKLKLPSHTPQKSTKNLNISLDIYKNTPTKPKSKTDHSKLSITQRLERIELLQREDRIYSHKLYELKRQQQQRSSDMTVKKQLNSGQGLLKDINSAVQLPKYQKQVVEQALEVNSNLLSSRTQSHISPIMKLTRQPLHALSQQKEVNHSKERIIQPQQIAQSDLQENVQSSRLTDRLHHKFFKKRIIYREKKISEDYMKILQQRGRKILELDNESQN